MIGSRRAWIRGLALILVATGVTFGWVNPASAHGHGSGSTPKVVVEGLNGPFGLAVTGHKAYIAETDAGKITAADLRTGAKHTIVSGLVGPSSVAVLGHGKLLVTTGGSEVPDTESNGTASLFIVKHGHARLVADLQAYELKHNPDGQLQFDPTTGEALDALSNPFAVVAGRGRHTLALVADAGANAILRVDRWGHVSTFFVPPLVTDGACAGAPNNDPDHVGCDPVPTGVAYGPHGTIWVSTASALTPGEGRIYVLNRWGHVLRTIKGLDAPTGIAVDRWGTAYVSEVLYGAPEGEEPGPDFDPSTVGRLVKIDWRGHQSYAAVTMPTGVALGACGQLYSTAWSVAGQFLGIPDAGQVVRVPRGAFHSS